MSIKLPARHVSTDGPLPLDHRLLRMRSQAQQISGQTYATAISQFGVGSQILVYGQPQTYTATITTVFVGGTAPPPTGSLLFQNASTTLATFNLAQGTTSGSQVVRSLLASLPHSCLPVKTPVEQQRCHKGPEHHIIMHASLQSRQ